MRARSTAPHQPRRSRPELVSGKMRMEGIVTPVVPFEESAEAYRAIDEQPEASIKLGIRF